MIFDKSKITALQKDLEDVNAELQAKASEIESLKQQLAQKESELQANFESGITQLKKEHEAKIEALNKEFEAKLEAQKKNEEDRISQEVIARIAAAGSEPITRVENPKDSKQITFEQLQQMPLKQHAEFFKNGGQIVG